ncbi:MAG: T9SS type A sorting domain-containing protein [Candidatus Kapabacteria bacterium]|nr:T9SS type A sorting domain-containing protein [Candidatus Kapabacteria bacterium]
MRPYSQQFFSSAQDSLPETRIQPSLQASSGIPPSRREATLLRDAKGNAQLVRMALLLALVWSVLMFFALGRLSAQQLGLSQISDQTTPLNTPLSVSVSVFDVNPNTVSVLGLSDNPSLIADNNIVISQSGALRQITITPTSGQSGTTQISIVATNAMGQNTLMTFRITVGGANFSPVISPISPTSTPAGTPITIPFTITDASPGTVTVSASSDNAAIVPQSGLVFGGFGTSRTLTVTPSINFLGSVVITVFATNQSGFSSRTSFTLTITQPAPAQAPTITNLPDLATAAGTPVSALFTVLDAAGAQNVTVFAFSSTPEILPASAITLSGTGSSRQITLRPNAGQRGRVVVQLRATNASGLSASTAFSLYSVLPGDPPVVEGLRDTILPQNTLFTVPFRIIDANPNTVTITPSSANPDILANSGIVITGSGVNRTLTVTPLQNRFGEVTLNIGVRNQNNLAAFGVLRTIFVAPPRVGQIPALTTPVNTPVRQSFTVEDLDASTLTFQFSSSNPGLIPTSNISVTAQGLQGRTVTITPAPNQIGTAIITMTVTNIRGLSTTISFPVTVFQNQTPPSLGAIGSVTTARNVPVSTMFTVGDADITSLRFSVASSNPSVFPVSNIIVSGSGTQRIISLTPAPNQVGSSLITLTVTNSFGLSVQTSFLATVVPPPAAPTLRAVVNLTTFRNTPISMQFVASDENLATLQLSAVSSNQALFPNSNLFLSGAGTLRTITMSPAFNQLGVSTITITGVNQQGQVATLDFTVTVVPPLLPPTISPIGNITIGQNQSATRNFTVTDHLDVNQVRFSFESTNQTLQPVSRMQVLGSGTTRALNLAPSLNQSGTSDITLTVTNSQGLSANTSFRLTVIPPPVGGEFAPSSLTTERGRETSSTIRVEDGSGFPITFSIQSSNEALVPVGNVRVVDLGGNQYRIIATPVDGRTGRARITVTISNGFSSIVRFLDIDVIAPPPPPAIPTIPFLIAPSNLTTGLSPFGNRFVWSRVPGAFLYQVQIANDSLFDLIYLNNDQLTDTTWFVTDFGVNRQYFWRVRARFGLMNGGWSEIWTFTTGRARPGGSTMTNAEASNNAVLQTSSAQQNSVETFGQTRLLANVPNPFSDVTRIEYELGVEMPVRIEITDALGKPITELVSGTKAKGAYSLEFQAKNLASGVYWCVLYTPREVFRQKMVVRK